VQREDYVIRLIKQLGDFLARIAGHRKREHYDAAMSEAARAWDELLGVPRELVERVDTPTLAGLLHDDAASYRIAAELLAEEARVLAARGDLPHAAVANRRALELFLEARAVDRTEADDAAILELSRHVPANQLDARYRS
jgi:hypothetical protein